MKKTIIIALALLTACTTTQPEEVVVPDMTMEHLQPITVCASEINFKYDGQISKTSKAMANWYENIIKLNTNCVSSATFTIKEAIVKKDRDLDMLIYEEIMSAELVSTSIRGITSKAQAKIGNKLMLIQL